MNPVVATSEIGLRVAPFVIGGARPEPARCRVVIVRPGTNDLACRAMRQVHVRSFVSEGKLQHRDSRNLQAVPQSMNLRRDVAQILGKERQASKRLAQFKKQVVSRT